MADFDRCVTGTVALELIQLTLAETMVTEPPGVSHWRMVQERILNAPPPNNAEYRIGRVCSGSIGRSLGLLSRNCRRHSEERRQRESQQGL